MAKTAVKGAKSSPAQPLLSGREQIAALQAALNKKFVERDTVVEGALLALLSRQMMFLLGPPGTAKSDITRAICGALGGRFFETLLGKTTAPEELYGPISFKELQEDKYIRNTTGKLPEADIAFIDEIFKGSSAIINTLLPVINERKFHNNGVQELPLQVLFGASNELPQGEELGALWDRFVLRYSVDTIKGDDNFLQVMRREAVEIPQLPLDQLMQMQQEAAALPLSEKAEQTILKIRRDATQRGLYVSDRKWMQATRVVRAQAYLNGHAEVLDEDLVCLQHVLWPDPKDISMVRKLVMKHANPMGEVLVEMQDAIVAIEQELKKNESQNSDGDLKRRSAYVTEAYSKLKKIAARVETMKQSHPNNPHLQKLDNRLGEFSKFLRDTAFSFL